MKTPMPRRRIGTIALSALALWLSSRPAEAAPQETDPVFRLQLTVRTCNRANAQTDDVITASLRAGNLTVLDYGRDDFPRNDTFTYDLLATGITRFSDITRLEVRNTGTDGLCIRTLDLRVNGRRIFRRSFGANGQFIDSGGTPAVLSTAGQLRANGFWTIYQQPVFTLGQTIVMSRGEIESRVEATVGTALSGSPVGWGGLSGARHVEATRVNDTTLHLDLDTRVDTLAALRSLPAAAAVLDAFDTANDVIDTINGIITAIGFSPLGRLSLPNRNVDVDFDFGVSCGGGALTFGVTSPVVNVQTIPNLAIPNVPNVFGLSELADLLNQGIAALNGQLATLRAAIDTLVESELGIDTLETGMADSLAQIAIAFETPICPQIEVQTNGDLNLTLSF
jgi:hypothetical protein